MYLYIKIRICEYSSSSTQHARTLTCINAKNITTWWFKFKYRKASICLRWSNCAPILEARLQLCWEERFRNRSLGPYTYTDCCHLWRLFRGRCSLLKRHSYDNPSTCRLIYVVNTSNTKVETIFFTLIDSYLTNRLRYFPEWNPLENSYKMSNVNFQ